MPRFSIAQVKVLFGFAWGNQFFDWQPQRMSILQLNRAVQEGETKRFGKIGNDDLILSLESDNSEILLCHEGDIHIYFDQVTPFIEAILENVAATFPAIPKSRPNFNRHVHYSEKPTFIVGAEFANSSAEPYPIHLVSWRQVIAFPPGKVCHIKGYGPHPLPLPIFQESPEKLTIQHWPGDRIVVSSTESDNFVAKILFDTNEQQSKSMD